MAEVDINLLAVLVAAIASMIVGAVWYSPALFAKRWLALMKKSEAELEQMKKKAPRAYALSFVGALVMSYVLAHIVDCAQATTVAGGLESGFWLWLGFVGTTNLSGVLFEDRPTGLYLINMGHYLVSLLIMGAILAVWT
ncbi:MAG: DUF1761 domain-containing protein [Bacteroidota bacterium]